MPPLKSGKAVTEPIKIKATEEDGWVYPEGVGSSGQSSSSKTSKSKVSSSSKASSSTEKRKRAKPPNKPLSETPVAKKKRPGRVAPPSPQGTRK